MILRVAAALALAVHTAPSPAPFEGMAEERMVVTHEGEEIGSSFRMFFTRTAWRMEMDIRPPHTSSPGARHELGSYEMFRLVAFGKIAEPTKAWLVNDRTRAYAVMVLDPAAHDLQEDAALWNITRRGKDRIAGLWCDNVTAQRIDQSESWDACLSSRLPRTAMESLNHIDVEGWLAAARRAGVEGRPLRAVWRGHDGAERARWEYVRFERRALPAALFEVPAGYRETSVIKAMAQSAEMERAMAEAEKHKAEMLEAAPPEQRKTLEQMMREPGEETP